MFSGFRDAANGVISRLSSSVAPEALPVTTAQPLSISPVGYAS